MSELGSPLATLGRYVGIMKALDKSDEPTATDRWAWSNEVEQGKFTLNLITELWKTADGPTKEIYKDLLISLDSGFTPMQRAASQALRQHGPMNPMAQKMEQFDKTRRRPEVTAKLDEEPYAFAEQVKALDRYEALRESVRTGKGPVFRNLIGVGNGMFVVEDKNGRPTVATKEELALDALAEKEDMSPAQIIAQNGWKYKPKVEFASGGELFSLRERYNVLDPSQGVQREVGPTSGTLTKRSAETEKWTSFLAAFAAGDDKHKGFEGYNQLALSGATDQERQDYLTSLFPGRMFNYIPKKTWWARHMNNDADSWVDPPDSVKQSGKMFNSWPVTGKIEIEGNEYYFNEPTNTVYDADGKSYGTPDELRDLLLRGK